MIHRTGHSDSIIAELPWPGRSSGTFATISASIGIPPLFAADVVAHAVERWRTGSDRSNAFDADVAAARKAWASLIGVAPENVAIGASVSQLVGLVAASVPDGTRVLAVAGEFTSVIFPFVAQAHRGVTVTEVEPTELLSHVKAHNLIAVSIVQSADGAIADVDRLRVTPGGFRDTVRVYARDTRNKM